MLKKYKISVAVILSPNLQCEVCAKFSKKLLVATKKSIYYQNICLHHTYTYFSAQFTDFLQLCSNYLVDIQISEFPILKHY